MQKVFIPLFYPRYFYPGVVKKKKESKGEITWKFLKGGKPSPHQTIGIGLIFLMDIL